MNYDKVAENDLPKQKYQYEELYQKDNGQIVSEKVDKDVKYDRKAKLLCGIGFEKRLNGEELQDLPKYFFLVNEKGTFSFFKLF